MGQVFLQGFIESEGVGPHGVVSVACVVWNFREGELLLVVIFPLRHRDVLVESRILGCKVRVAQRQVAVQSLPKQQLIRQGRLKIINN